MGLGRLAQPGLILGSGISPEILYILQDSFTEKNTKE
jgi:hypothetical protein